ncbi:mismatch repair endonuclease PMS2 isoform X2 [Poecilia formosa]|uniref:mismatch repair endonuclease PMS2 isoform X1 n=1 Tax=Poecilia formosa TaxID=48698 RepID=UPI0007B8983D|nr:PREDICTED: mismatch repair endonuclease PMS2 isoform X1 [Poecilia formosa]XP_016530316.1 PREDICTED: mismatch repair endonuclease PMS2 isoform X2 [Poecilia formosa]
MTDVCTSEPAGAIRAIDKHSVHRICSGQVVLSLATAVKELVENSIDAGATNVEVKLKECGAEQIEVSDNGRGVEEANFEGLALKHHTSKLRDFSDLIHVETFGFRGEALSSLCALSDLSVITCHESSQIGTKLLFDHKGHLVQQSPCPRQQGTTVTLQQLFYTLPVRHKEFQRNIKKEFAKMIHVLQAYCIVSTGVRITCSNQTGQGKRSAVLSTGGSQSMRDNIGAIFGPKQMQSLLPFRQVSPSENIMEEYGLKDGDLPKQLFTLSGFVSTGDHGVGRSASDRQFFFINSRPCDPVKVSKLVNEVYHMYNRHQYPFVALNIAVASDCVDVNVTPDKRQIFLQEEKLLLAILKSSLINMYEAGVNKMSLNYTPTVSSASKEVHLPVEDKAEPAETNQPGTPSPKSTMNLAALKAAFSNQNSALSGSKSSTEKASKSGPSQKTLQCFFKGSVKSPVQPRREAAKGSLGVWAELHRFRNERASVRENDSERGLAVESQDPQHPVSFKPVVENVTHDSSVSQNLHEDPELQAEACSPVEDSVIIPEAKRARRDDPRFTAERTPDTASSTTDVPVCLQRRTMPLHFCLQALAAGMKRLQQQQRRRAADRLCYRRFRANISPGENQRAEDELRREISKDMFKEMEIIGQFNLGFIITKLNSDIFMIDQHATDEKYNFEMLQQHTVLQGQRLIVPQKLHLTAVSENVLLENVEIFQKNGFEFLIDEDGRTVIRLLQAGRTVPSCSHCEVIPSAQVMERVKLVSLPTSRNWTFGPADIEELIFMLSDSPGVMCRPSRVRQMFASRACRKSVMIGTALSVSEMKKLVIHMGEIEHPWNCPHGRPTMRHLANLEIISQD